MARPVDMSPAWPGEAGPWTEADLARLPNDGHRYETIDGESARDPARQLRAPRGGGRGPPRPAVDRFTKPGQYAEAGIESYWRIERTEAGPVAHLYTRAAAGHYQLHRSVRAGQCVTAELPYAVQVAPATWH